MRLPKHALTFASWLAVLAVPIAAAQAATPAAAAPKPAAPAAAPTPAAPAAAPASTLDADAAATAPAPQATTSGSVQGNVGLQLGSSGSTSSGSLSEFFDNYSLRFGLEAAGPLHFRDAPDGRVEQTTVFPFGFKLAFLFGHEVKDIHRAGLQLSYLSVAKSDNRSLKMIPIDLVYEIGHPLVLQVLLGYNAQAGSGFESKYGGLSTGMALRYSFQSLEKWSPVTVSPGIIARANISSDSMQYSTVFLGAQLEVSYDTNN